MLSTNASRVKKYRENNLDKSKQMMVNWRKNNPEVVKAINLKYTQKSRAENPELWMYYSAKKRARARNLEFNLEKSDIIIPDMCPVFDIPLFKVGGGAAKDNSPSLDRVDNSKGYIKGNIAVISAKANRIKSNATAEEIRKVADWLDSIVGS